MIGITGARGVLGGALLRSWPAAEVSVFEGDIRDADGVEAWVRSAGVTSILHCAAIVPVAKVEKEPKRAFDVNAGGTLNLCEAVRRVRPGAWICVASTSHVYGPSENPLDETAATEPHSLYGFTKLEAERIALTWARRFSLSVCAGRIFSFSAKGQSDDYVLPSLVRRIREAERGATLRVAGGLQSRDFLTTSSIAVAIALLEKQRATGIYNIGSGRAVRIVDAASRLAAMLGRTDLHIVADDENQQKLVADISKIEALGFAPGDDIDALLAELAAS